MKRFVLKAPDGRYWKGNLFRGSLSECLTTDRKNACQYDAEVGEELGADMFPVRPRSAQEFIEAGMLTKEYLPETRYGVMVRYQDTYPGEVRVKYLCHQPDWPREGYVLIQHPSQEFPIVTWATVEEIPFKVSAVGFGGHDRLVAVEVVDGEVSH